MKQALSLIAIALVVGFVAALITYLFGTLPKTSDRLLVFAAGSSVLYWYLVFALVQRRKN